MGTRGLQSMLWEETMSSIALNYTDSQQFVNVSFAPSHIWALVWSSRKKHPIFWSVVKNNGNTKTGMKYLLTVWPHWQWRNNTEGEARIGNTQNGSWYKVKLDLTSSSLGRWRKTRKPEAPENDVKFYLDRLWKLFAAGWQEPSVESHVACTPSTHRFGGWGARGWGLMDHQFGDITCFKTI